MHNFTSKGGFEIVWEQESSAASRKHWMHVTAVTRGPSPFPLSQSPALPWNQKASIHLWKRKSGPVKGRKQVYNRIFLNNKCRQDKLLGPGNMHQNVRDAEKLPSDCLCLSVFLWHFEKISRFKRDWREETQLHYFKKGKAPDQGPPVSRLTVDAGSQGSSVAGGSGRTLGKAGWRRLGRRVRLRELGGGF